MNPLFFDKFPDFSDIPRPWEDNGEDFDDFGDITSPEVLLENNSYYTVLRGDKRIDIFIPTNFIEQLSEKNARGKFIQPLFPFEVGAVSKKSEAEKIGLKEGDRIVKIGEKNVNFFSDFQIEKSTYANKEIPLVVQRGGQTIYLTGNLDSTATLGFFPNMLLTMSHKNYSFLQAIPAGTSQAFSAVWVNAKALGKVLKGEINPSKSLMGPIRIATEIFGGTWNWVRFWSITGLLSMVLAFMNFLPIPALDGGHVMFLSFEMISGRRPSDKFLEAAQKVGMVLLLALMAFVIFNDIFRLDFFQNLIGG